MDYGILALIPILVLIIGVIITKRMLEMLIISSALAAVIMGGKDFLSCYVEGIHNTIASETYQLILFILLGVGAMISLFQDSGAMNGFGQSIAKYVDTPKKSIIATWLMGVILFFDDYMNTLSVTFSMRNITDKNNVPREHLAYTAGAMGASLCVLVPFTSWSAFAMATASEYGVTFGSYMKSIPYMFLPILVVLCALLVAIGIVPKVGNVKKGYERVRAGGSVYFPGDKTEGGEKIDESKSLHPVNFFLPLIVLVTVMIIMDNSMEYGIMAALVTQFLLYIPQKALTADQFIKSMLNGFRNFCDIAITIFLAYMTAEMCLEMGMADFIISHVVTTVPAWALPALMFIVVGLIGCTADSWVITVLTIPIFLPMAQEAGIGLVLPMAAIMSGIVLANKVCLFADEVFMIAAGTGVDNASQIKTTAPYILTCSFLTVVLYAGIGFVQFN